MRVERFEVEGYRSIRGVWLRMGDLNLIVGANGCGKSNLYRALGVMKAAAEGRLARAIGEEGGMSSLLWAGARRKGPVRVRFLVELEGLAYELELGLPRVDQRTMFRLDPQVKEERVWAVDRGVGVGGGGMGGSGRGGGGGGVGKKVLLVERTNQVVAGRNAEGRMGVVTIEVSPSESVLSEVREGGMFPELTLLRNVFSSWRFYHQFRVDGDSAIRRPQMGVRTARMADDGSDLVSALQTIREDGEGRRLEEAIELAFPGSRLEVGSQGDYLAMSMVVPGIMRGFTQREMSDGTLQFLALAAALLSPRPAPLIAINEPETSLHPDVLVGLAELMAHASERSQLWLTTHSERLCELVEERTTVKPVRLEKVEGETRLVGGSGVGEL